jgi:predicted metal-dependent HD superfamily phosphohydrolase
VDRPTVTIADWTAVLGRLGVDEAAAAGSGAALLAAYGAAHRRYHSLRHLGAVVAVIDELADLAADPDLVRLAAWYHDAVYEPDGPGGDEQRSARLARADLTGLGLAAGSVDEVARLVELTETHNPAPHDLNGAVLCDADLWILGAERDDYDRYADEVRAEYAHVPDAAWRSGRAAVLRHFLDRPAIYTTKLGRRRDQAAGANLERELRSFG